ncbi:MAG: triose-phosphate isomerase [Halobacteriales archaeon]
MYLVVNLKTYADGTGEAAEEIARAAGRVAEDADARVAVAAQAADLHRVSRHVEALAQHVDGVSYGSNTGAVLPEAAAASGATGSLLNHSERRLRLADVDGGVRALDRAGMTSVVCANDARQVAAAAELEPDYVAVEPPELIGTGTPVSKADPDVVRDAVERVEGVGDVPVLCGAGITSGDDVGAALELGAEGVLVASGVVKADDPEKAIRDLLSY